MFSIVKLGMLRLQFTILAAGKDFFGLRRFSNLDKLIAMRRILNNAMFSDAKHCSTFPAFLAMLSILSIAHHP